MNTYIFYATSYFRNITQKAICSGNLLFCSVNLQKKNTHLSQITTKYLNMTTEKIEKTTVLKKITTNKPKSTTKVVKKNTEETPITTKEEICSDKNEKKTTDLPWSIRGVTPETRAYVIKAAQKENKKLGEWINDKLLKSAQEVFLDKIHPIAKMEDKEVISKILSVENSQLEQNAKIDQLTALVENIVKNQNKSIFGKLFRLK